MKKFLLLALSLLVLSSNTMAADLTGHWEGVAVCKQFIGLAEPSSLFEKRFSVPATLEISQFENELYVQIESIGYLSMPFKGNVIPDEDKPDDGQAVIHSCSISEFYKVVRADISTLGVGKETKFHGDAIGWLPEGGILQPYGNIQSCTWSFEQVDSVDPEIADSVSYHCDTYGY